MAQLDEIITTLDDASGKIDEADELLMIMELAGEDTAKERAALETVAEKVTKYKDAIKQVRG